MRGRLWLWGILFTTLYAAEPRTIINARRTASIQANAFATSRRWKDGGRRGFIYGDRNGRPQVRTPKLVVARHDDCCGCGEGTNRDTSILDRTTSSEHNHHHHHPPPHSSHSHSHSHNHDRHQHGSPSSPSAAGSLALAVQSEGGDQKKEGEPISNLSMVSDMMKSLWRRDPGLALTGSLLLVSAKAAKILVPVLYKLIFDQIEHVTTDAVSMTTATLFGVSALVLGHMGARSVAQGLQSINDVIFARSVQTVTRDLGRRSLSRLLALDASFYTNANVGAMTRVVERGMRATQTVLSRLFMHLVPQFVELTIVAYIIYLKAGVAMAAGAVATVTAYAAFTLATVKKRNVFLREMNVQDNQATGRVLETLLNYEVVNSFNRQEHQIDSYDKTLQQYQKAQRGSLRQLALLNFGQRTIEAVGQGALLLRTALLVSTGAMTIGDLLMVNALLAQLMGPLDHLGANYMQLTQGLIEGKELYRLIDTQTNVSANADCPPLKVKSGTIEIKNITFGYPSSAQDVPLFQGFDLTIEGGKTIGIVGESGCGKSTLSRLLTRFYDVQGGKILVDEQDISKDVSLASVRHAITTVSQDTKLFNEDILSNLKYGAPDASNEDVERVTEKVQLSEDIKAMDGGYGTVVGDRGSRLSGGQRQRAGLGRALLKNPDILICDEVTGALDVGTESRVMQSLYEMRKGRTTVVIAHRLATVKEADEIIVMKAGKIAERGSHLELTSRPDSLYSAMWKQQLQEGGSEHTHDHHHHHHHHHDEHEEDHLQQEISSGGGGHDHCGCGHGH